MMIASEGNCQEFMKHRACQEYLDRVWAHTLQIKSFSLRFFFSLVIGAICPPFVPFVAEYDESKYDKSPDAKEVRKKFTVRFYRQKLRDFYLAPCVRHAYQLLAMIILFIFFVIDLEIETDFENPFMCFSSTFLIFLATVHTIEFLRIALVNWISFRMFISQPYNRLLLTACLGYIVGTTVQILMYFVVPRTYVLEQFSQICLVCAILYPFGKI
ncbi:unnamed protein product [Hymenolepis diminuta]|uniref:Adenylate cyclase type 9 n=1 Tax=Hymenolepis diminuta TaxID=6216 RepID=A0A0R3SZ57_HYMDI|nr:unnamed protein product [Hymenolepis diminuta]